MTQQSNWQHIIDSFEPAAPPATGTLGENVAAIFSSSHEQEIAATARRIWPAGDLPVEKGPWFCEMFARIAPSGRSLVHFEPKVNVEGQTVVIGGATNIERMRDTLVYALRALGVQDVRNEMRLLPEDGRLGKDRFGVCTAPMVLTYNAPTKDAGLQTQLLYGEPVLLLDKAGDYLLALGGGWLLGMGSRRLYFPHVGRCLPPIHGRPAGGLYARRRAPRTPHRPRRLPAG